MSDTHWDRRKNGAYQMILDWGSNRRRCASVRGDPATRTCWNGRWPPSGWSGDWTRIPAAVPAIGRSRPTVESATSPVAPSRCRRPAAASSCRHSRAKSPSILRRRPSKRYCFHEYWSAFTLFSLPKTYAHHERVVQYLFSVRLPFDFILSWKRSYYSPINWGNQILLRITKLHKSLKTSILNHSAIVPNKVHNHQFSCVLLDSGGFIRSFRNNQLTNRFIFLQIPQKQSYWDL